MADFEDTGSMTLTEQPALGGEGAGQMPLAAEPVAEPVKPEPEAKPEAKPEPKKPESVRDAVAAAMREQDQATKDNDKPEKDAKPDAEKPAADADKTEGKEAKAEGEEKPAKARDEGGKFSKAEGKEDAPQFEKRSADPRDDAPAKFQADAKERWANVPTPVKRDIQVMLRDHETEITRHREASERYEPLRHYDEHARQLGRGGLHEAVQDYVRLEDAMGSNPLAAINEMLQRAGPAKADGQKISLFELASAVVQMGPQGYQQAIQQAQAGQQPQEDPRIAQMEQQMRYMQAQHVTATVIEPFKASHPRYDELAKDIAFFLQSDKINPSLSTQERLEVAYDMAERINPSSHVSTQEPTAHSTDSRVEPTPAAKSIKSAPGAVTPDMEPVRGGSIEDIIRDEARRLGVSGRR